MRIWVVDNGSQWTHRQGRVLRYLKHEVNIQPNDTPLAEIRAWNPDGLLLSGSGSRIGLDGKLGLVDQILDEFKVPILGVCAGHQYIGSHFGGKAAPGANAEFGRVEIDVLDQDDILRDVPAKTTVWASHNDEVSVVPPGFKVLASSADCPVQVMRHTKRPIFGFSFHPEVEHTEHGVQMFRNFVRICEEAKAKHAPSA